MALLLNEEQRMVKSTAADFLDKRMPVSEFRRMRDAELRSEPSHWQAMSELGWPAMTIAEQHGGLGFGYLGLGAIFEECGRRLAPSPLLSTVVLCASIIELADNAVLQQSLLPGICSGELKLALALEEQAHHRCGDFATRARAQDGALQISGDKRMVIDGAQADQFVVAASLANSADEAAQTALLLVPADSEGITVVARTTIDHRDYVDIHFDDVRVEADALIADGDRAVSILAKALDRGRICLAAEMLGAALECFDRSLAWLKEREQFGVKIGSFQALQHRAAIMFCELELLKSVVLDALSAVDEARADCPQMASLAKARAGDVLDLVSSEAVQMHGGIGVTDELDIGLFLKRSRACNALLGDASFHRDRYARLCGY